MNEHHDMTARAIRCRDPVTHYRTDAEVFDYFETPPPIEGEFWQRMHTALIKTLKLRAGMHIVDVGSGNGWVSQTLQGRNITVTSVDLSRSNIRRIRETYGTEGIIAVAGSLPVCDKSVDAVIASEVIEHLNDPQQAIREFIRIVKPGGRVVISTPYREKIKMNLCIHCNRLTPSNAHLHSFDENQLISMFSHEDIHEIRYHRIGNKVLLHSRIYYLLRWIPYPLWSIIDRMANMLIGKQLHIIVCGIKRGKEQ